MLPPTSSFECIRFFGDVASRDYDNVLACKMAKTKRKISSDNAANRKKNRSQNPFEVRFNHQKRSVLGRKTKHDRGLPGISRSKATEKRKKTLLKEYQERFKANKFVDRRIGEYDPSLSVDDKMAARFVAERKPSFKNAMYNLEEEEVLTHYGQSLATIEKFDDPRSDSDEDEDQRLGAEFVKSAHFGGGFLTKKEEGAEDDGESKSRQDLIDELIARTKERKREARVAKEETCELTDKLDGEWKEMMPLLTSRKAPEEQRGDDGPGDDYDRIVRELKFEMRAKPTDRLKTAEELAKENKEALEKLEADRILRMKGLADGSNAARPTSDDLNSGPVADRVRGTAEVLRYDDDGRLIAPASVGRDETIRQDRSGNVEDSVILSSGENSRGRVRDIRLDLQKRKAAMDDARSEIPYVLPVPQDYDSFSEMVGNLSADEQITVVDRILKCNHPSISDENTGKLEILFAILLQHLSEMSCRQPPRTDVVDALVPFVHDLAKLNPDGCARYVRAAVLRKQRDFARTCSAGKRTSLPEPDTLIFLKLVALLFPTSDFWHSVATPSLLFMSQILIWCPVDTRRGIACGLFVTNLFLEYVQLSRRFVPEAVKFLCQALFTSFSAEEREELRLLTTLRMPRATTLRVDQDSQDLEPGKLSVADVASDEPTTDSFRCTAVHVCLELLERFAGLYNSLQSHKSIFSDVQKMVEVMSIRPNQTPALKDRVCKLRSILTKDRPVEVLVHEIRDRQSSFKFHDPVFEERFDGRKKRKGDRAFHEKQKLTHKYKKELKGAVREIRMDNRFLARHHLKETQERDNERKQKLKRLYHDLANQEHDVKSLKRKKSQDK